jgi:hypothetical protein
VQSCAGLHRFGMRARFIDRHARNGVKPKAAAGA